MKSNFPEAEHYQASTNYLRKYLSEKSSGCADPNTQDSHECEDPQISRDQVHAEFWEVWDLRFHQCLLVDLLKVPSQFKLLNTET